jgi:streptogramin lyase
VVIVCCVLLGACRGGSEPQVTVTPPGSEVAQTEHETPTDATTTPATAPPAGPTPVPSLRATPVRRRVEKRFDLPSPDWLGAGAGSIWVKRDDGVLTRVDPETNTVVRNITLQRRGAQSCQGLGVSDGAVWACGGDTDVVRVDPATNKVVARVPIGKSADQTSIPIVAGHAWFLVGDGSSLRGVSLRSNEVAAEIQLDTRCVDLAADAKMIWAACLSDSVVLRIDPTAQAVAATITGLEKPRSLAVGDDLWVGYGGAIARIDRATDTVTGAVAVSAVDGGIFAGEQAVWVRRDGTFLQRLDPRTMARVEVLGAPETSGGSVVEAFGSVWATAYNDSVLYRLRP